MIRNKYMQSLMDETYPNVAIRKSTSPTRRPLRNIHAELIAEDIAARAATGEFEAMALLTHPEAGGSAIRAAYLVVDSLHPKDAGDNQTMTILSTMPFVLTIDGNLGIASDGTFAAQAWRISDEAFNSIGGRAFSWIAPDGKDYTDGRNMFIRPTEDQIRQKMTPALKQKAIEFGLITEKTEQNEPDNI